MTSAHRTAIGFDAELGDSVAVTASAPLPMAAGDPLANASADAPVIAAPRESAEPTANGSLMSWLWLPLLICLAILAYLLLLRRRSDAPRMSEREQLATIANLRTLLSERSADAAPAA